MEGCCPGGNLGGQCREQRALGGGQDQLGPEGVSQDLVGAGGSVDTREHLVQAFACWHLILRQFS